MIIGYIINIINRKQASFAPKNGWGIHPCIYITVVMSHY